MPVAPHVLRLPLVDLDEDLLLPLARRRDHALIAARHAGVPRHDRCVVAGPAVDPHRRPGHLQHDRAGAPLEDARVDRRAEGRGLVSDQVASPTYTPHLAQALALLIETEEYGIHHMAAGGRCSWFEYAQEIFDQAGVDCRVMAGTTEMLGRPAPRPPLSLLVSERPDPISLPDWHQGLSEYLAAREASVVR